MRTTILILLSMVSVAHAEPFSIPITYTFDDAPKVVSLTGTSWYMQLILGDPAAKIPVKILSHLSTTYMTPTPYFRVDESNRGFFTNVPWSYYIDGIQKHSWNQTIGYMSDSSIRFNLNPSKIQLGDPFARIETLNHLDYFDMTFFMGAVNPGFTITFVGDGIVGVPEPSSIAVIGLSIVGLVAIPSRRRRLQAA